MKCHICGRELTPGQSVCECGTPVYGGTSYSSASSSSGTDYNSMYAEDALPGLRPKQSKLPLIVGIIVAVVIAAAVILAGWTLFFRDKYNITHEDKWETIERTDYRITIPAGMREIPMQVQNGSTMEDAFRSSEAVIGISYTPLTSDQQKMVSNTTKLQDKLIAAFPSEVDGIPIEAQKRGQMIYVTYQTDYEGAFIGTSRVEVTDAIFIGQTRLYEVEIYMPLDKYPQYSETALKWLDSFHIK